MREFSFSYSRLEQVIHGADAVQVIPGLVDESGCRRVFVLASRTLGANTDTLERLSAALGPRLAGVFTEVPAHTPRSAVLRALEQARAAQTDLLVTVGGGSVIDCAKAVQLGLTQNLDSEAALLDYARFADGSKGPKAGDFSLFKGPSAIRQIAVPTTLSGAEFSNNAGVMDTDKSLKEGYQGPDLCPRVIVYDPALSVHTPQWLWLSTAIRSLDHAVEGYCSKAVNSYLEGLFLHAMTLFSQALPASYEAPGDLVQRSRCQQAVWLACCGLGQVSHGASHGIGYLLGAVSGVPHGYTSCVMLPAVLTWNSRINGDRQVQIANALGKPGGSAAAAIHSLVAALGLPTTLQQVGVRREDLPRIAELAARHPVVRRNPRPISSTSQVMEILELAWEGSLL